jgi:hypothetical protein
MEENSSMKRLYLLVLLGLTAICCAGCGGNSESPTAEMSPEAKARFEEQRRNAEELSRRGRPASAAPQNP